MRCTGAADTDRSSGGALGCLPRHHRSAAPGPAGRRAQCGADTNRRCDSARRHCRVPTGMCCCLGPSCCPMMSCVHCARAAWATTAACYVSAVAAWILVARRPSSGEPWLPPPGQVFASAFLGKPSPNQSASSQKNWMALLKANAAMSVRTFSSLTTWLVACAIITKIGVAPPT